MAIHKPQAAVVRARSSERPRPASIDYADEHQMLGAMRPLTMPEDQVSVAVGSIMFIQYPGPKDLPWAEKPAETDAERLFVRPRLEFTRLYPSERMLVDILPNRAGLDRERLQAIHQDVLVKGALSRENGYAYVHLHAGDPVDVSLFTDAKKGVSQKTAATVPVVALMPSGVEIPMAVGGVTVEMRPLQTPAMQSGGGVASDGFNRDEISAVVGHNQYIEHASIAKLPWAYTERPGTGEWAREPMVFSRYYHMVGIVVDLYSNLSMVSQTEREKADAQIEVRRLKCAEHGLVYLSLEAGVVLTRADLEVAAAFVQETNAGIQAPATSVDPGVDEDEDDDPGED